MDYLKERVTPLLQPMLVEMARLRPQEPMKFIREWVNEKFQQSPEENKEESGKQGPPARDDDSEKEISSDNDDDLVDDIPIKRKTGITRKAISAEAYGAYNKKEDFVARVIPKTQEQRDRILNKLNSSFLFSALDQKEVEIVIGAMEERQFKPGEYVIQQGDDGDNLYVVESGRLTCSKRFAPNEEPKYLKEYQPGEAFGELALLYNAPRAANIIAKTDCSLWSLDRPTFTNIVKDAAMRKREKYEKFLKSVKILSTVESYELTLIVDAVKPISFKKGEFIIREGDEGNVFFLLEQGEAVATKVLEPGKPAVKVMEYKRGCYFGELALLRNAPRAASIIAQTECTCLSLDRHSFKRLLGPLDEILKRNTDIYEQYSH